MDIRGIPDVTKNEVASLNELKKLKANAHIIFTEGKKDGMFEAHSCAETPSFEVCGHCVFNNMGCTFSLAKER